MDEDFCLPPWTQVLARIYASTFESPSRLARRRQQNQKLTCRPNHWHLNLSIGPLRFVLAVALLVSGVSAHNAFAAAEIGALDASSHNVEFSTVAVGQRAGSSSNWSHRSRGPALSSVACSQSSITGSGGVACAVTLSAAAASGGLAVSLSSNDSAVTVPPTVTVPAGATSAGFTATVSSVTIAQSATLTASVSRNTRTYTIALGAAGPGLNLSSTSLDFGSVTLNTRSNLQSVTLTSSGTTPLIINSAVLTGAGFSVSGTSFPVTLNPGQTATLAVFFDPTVAGTAGGTITISDNASPSAAAISLSGIGLATAGVLNGVSCASKSLTGSGSDACSVTLSAAAGSGGLAVSLSSTDSAVAVPSAVSVPAGATSAGFTAAVSAVTTVQNATLTASAGGVSKTLALQLNAAVPTLSINTSSVAFGDITINTAANQSVTFSSSGSAAVTVSSAKVAGTGFSLSGMTFPVTLTPGQSAALNVAFDPTTTGSVSGQVTISSNSSTNPTATVSLSAVGVAATYQVNLAWTAPTSSPDPVAGYDVYRAPSGTGSYQLLGSALSTLTTYVDSNVQTGLSYDYVIKSVDSSGVESASSNTTTAKIP
jgi:Cep192 domain 4